MNWRLPVSRPRGGGAAAWEPRTLLLYINIVYIIYYIVYQFIVYMYMYMYVCIYIYIYTHMILCRRQRDLPPLFSGALSPGRISWMHLVSVSFCCCFCFRLVFLSFCIYNRKNTYKNREQKQKNSKENRKEKKTFQLSSWVPRGHPSPLHRHSGAGPGCVSYLKVRCIAGILCVCVRYLTHYWPVFFQPYFRVGPLGNGPATVQDFSSILQSGPSLRFVRWTSSAGGSPGKSRQK